MAPRLVPPIPAGRARRGPAVRGSLRGRIRDGHRPCGGDYPAFYGAGSIVLDGDVDRLYDAQRQNEAQAELLGEEVGYLAFVYPPHVATAYAPLAALPYRLSYLIHTALMASAVLAGLHLLRPMVGMLDRFFWPTAAASISLFPLFRAVGAGQNTALTLLLIAVAWRALADERETLAGVALGLLLFRPQYAIPLIGLVFIARHHRAVAAAAGVGLATWLANAIILGPMWFTTWLEEVRPFIERDAEVNAGNSISWLGFGEAVLGPQAGRALGLAFAIATVGVLIALWRNSERFDLATRIAVSAAGIVLISPHTMFYDAGLLVITAVVATDRGWVTWRVAAGAWALALTHLAADGLGATPLAVVVIATFVGALSRAVTTTSPATGRRDPVGVRA